MAMIQSDRMHAPQQRNADTSDADGTWLLITSTMGLTLGYVRIDDHDHQLSLSEIRDMIHDKLKDNTEYCHGFNFGTGWPLKIVKQDEEATVLAQDVLPSVSVLSAHSAQHIANNNNPISAATAMQYGMMNFMQFPQTANSANLQPLPISAIFTPIHQLDQLTNNQVNKLPNSEQYYSPNTVALLQPQPQSRDTQAVKTEAVHSLQLFSANSNASHAEIPALPPFSPPTLSQQDIEQKQKTQKQKLQNLLPISRAAKKAENKMKTEMNTDLNKKFSNRNTPKNRQKPVVLPRLKPIGADGQIIQMSAEHKSDDKINHKKKKQINVPDKQAQKDLFCPECEKTFGNERGYRLHMTKQHQIKLARGRNKERRFRCDYAGCDRSFYQSSDLRRHQRVHLGVKPFKCSVCKKEFTQRGSLYRHIKSSHKGQDPKRLIILQTEETLPVSNGNAQKQKKTDDANTNIPPLISSDNTNNLPPEVNHNVIANVNNESNDNDDDNVKMSEKDQTNKID